jgi:outer membrane protein assembly factor BamB
MHTDRAYHAVITGTTLVFGNNVDNHVHALDTRTGKMKWSFAAEGSVRFAPMIDGDRVYFGSDDGNVYCLKVAQGTLVWKYRAGPSGERIIGRGRMVSLWPVRTGVLVEDGILYTTAGIFPYEGLYIAAVNAKTGKPIWVNDTVGDKAWGQLYGGMAPQGYLVASADTLFVPAGRSMPVAFDKRTGKFKRFLNAGGKIGGSWAVMDGNKLYAGIGNQGTDTKIEFDAKSGGSRGDQFSRYPSRDMVLTKDTAYIATKKGIYGIDRAANFKANSAVPVLDKESGALVKNIAAIRKRHKAAADKPEELKKLTAELAKATSRLTAIAKEKSTLNGARVKWFAPREGVGPLALAGGTLFAGGDGFVISVEAATGKRVMEHALKSRVFTLAVADNRLFVSTADGAIHCLAPRALAAGGRTIKPSFAAPSFAPKIEVAAKTVLDMAKVDRGWCLVAGARDGSLAEYLARKTSLNIVVVEHDAKRLQVIRARLMRAGLFGSRVTLLDAPYTVLPDYFANLIVSERAMFGEELDLPVDQLARVLRPSGGQLVLGSIKAWPQASVIKIVDGLKANARAKTKVRFADNHLHFTRGKLDGAGSWTGLYGNTANTSSTPDTLVEGPLGVLWYGEPGSEDMVDRHARAASPLAINGRLIMQGEEVVMAYDAYNGTFLWKRKIPGAVRVHVDIDGSNITATDDAVFVATKNRVLQLDAQTGKTIREFLVPRKEGGDELRWGYIAVQGNILIGSGAPKMARDYGHIWNSIVKDGKWVAEKDAPKNLLSTLKKVKAIHARPDAQAKAYFKRAGLQWNSMYDWPNWVGEFTPSAFTVKQMEKMMSSEKVFAYDISTGRMLWEHEGKSIPNISLVIGDGRVYFLKDDLDARERAQAKAATEANIAGGSFKKPKPGQEFPEKDRDYRRVMCLDVKTGRAIWSRPYDLTGSGGHKLGLAYQSGKLLAFGHFSNHDEKPFSKGGLDWRRITVIDASGGSLIWSKPLNYRRRPTIMGDTIYIEPRRCDLETGDIQKRKHPITGESVDWEFLRPGHSCGIVTATPNNIFFRSFSGAIVNTKQDSGLQLFGGVRPGCWNSMIPANGLLSMQEASAGCTCSYSLRTTVVLKNKPQKGHAEWAVFISGKTANKPVSHMAINFGAPGDMRAKDGTLWFGYPRPSTTIGQGSFRNYGIKFKLAEAGSIEVIQRDWRGRTFVGTDKPWLFTSGLKGISRFSVPLLAKGDKGKYTVRLGFTPLFGDKPGSRVFRVRIRGKSAAKQIADQVAKEKDATTKRIAATNAKKAYDTAITQKQKAETKLTAAKKATTDAVTAKTTADKALAVAKTATAKAAATIATKNLTQTRVAQKTAETALVAAKTNVANAQKVYTSTEKASKDAARKAVAAKIVADKAKAAVVAAQKVLLKFDVAKAAGGYGKVVEVKFEGLEVEGSGSIDGSGNLLVELVASGFKGAAAIEVHPKLHHLGDNVVAGWTESTPKPEGFVLTMPFEFKGGDEAYTLSIAQQDVHNGWLIVLNGREIGRLQKDTAKLTTRVPVPKGVLKKGANELVIRRAEKSQDDIQVGRVQLLTGHPASTVIQSIEVIRENQKTAAKR